MGVVDPLASGPILVMTGESGFDSPFSLPMLPRRMLSPGQYTFSSLAHLPSDQANRIIADLVFENLYKQGLDFLPPQNLSASAAIIKETFKAQEIEVDFAAFKELLDLVRLGEVSPHVVGLVSEYQVRDMSEDPAQQKMFLALKAIIKMLGAPYMIDFLEEHASPEPSPRALTPERVSLRAPSPEVVQACQSLSFRSISTDRHLQRVSDSTIAQMNLSSRVSSRVSHTPLILRIAHCFYHNIFRHLIDALYDILFLKVYRTAHSIFSTVLRCI